MTLAGKKLQILYDKGTEKISELENTTVENLDQIAKKHDVRRESDSDLDTQKLDAKAKHMESEINQLMDASYSKLEELKEEQTEKCRIHSDHLAEELNKIGDTIRVSLGNLIESIKDQLTDVNEDLAYDFDTSMDDSESMLEKQSFESTKAIHQHGSGSTNKLQQKLDQNVWESRGSEKQSVSQLYKSYMAKANGIEGHFSSLLKKLSNEYAGQFQRLEESISEAHTGIDSSTRNSVENLDLVTSEIEREINSFFGDKLSASSKNLDDKLTAMANEITNSHSVITLNLEQKTNDLSSGLLTAAAAAQDKLKHFAQEATQNGDRLTTEFTNRMESRVADSNLVRRELEQAKEECIKEIKEELISIREEFQESLLKLAKESEDEIFATTEAVERDIKAAHSRCFNKLEEDGRKAKDEIEAKVQNLLDRIAAHKQTALAEIAAAASGNQKS